MIPVRLNLTPQGGFYHQRVRNVLLTAALLMLMLDVWGTVLLTDRSFKLRQVRQDLRGTVERQPAHQLTSSQEFLQQQQRVRLLNELLAQQQEQRWIKLLDRLESLLPGGMLLTSLEPGQRGERLILKGQAGSFGSLEQLLSRLAKDRGFEDPVLVSHTLLLPAGADSMLQFELSVRWLPAGGP